MDNKETKTNVGVTATSTEVKENEVVKESIIRNPVFVIFAEFLGYESPLIDWAEKICNGKEVPNFIKHIVDVDAMSIFNKMKEEFTEEEISETWGKFYPAVLEEYDLTLASIEDKNYDGLPF